MYKDIYNMDKSTFSAFCDCQGKWFCPKDVSFPVIALGAREEMAPGMVSHGGAAMNHWLFMYFHTPALVKDNSSGRMLPAGNSFMLWEPGTYHCYGNGEDKWIHSWMFLPAGSKADPGLLPVGRPVNCPPERFPGDYFSILLRELLPGVGDPAVVELLLQIFMRKLRKSVDRMQYPAQCFLNLQQFIHSHIAGEISVEEMAKAVNLSVSRFRTLFVRCYGESPLAYVTRKRLEMAYGMLEFGCYSCKEASSRCGFKDQLYFSRLFRRHYGFPPSKLKKQ